ELGTGCGRKGWVDRPRGRLAADTCNRRDVANEIERELVIERGVDRMRAGDQEERVAVRRRPDDRLGADRAAGSGAVVDHERLAEPFLQPLRQRPRKNVAGAARGRESPANAPPP